MLRNTLGPWISPPHRSHRWFYSADQHELYHHVDDFVHVYSPNMADVSFTRSGPRFDRCQIQRQVPTNAEWCSIKQIRNGSVHCLAVEHPGNTLCPVPDLPSVRSRLRSSTHRWLWTHVSASSGDNFLWLISALINGTAVFASDGSFNRLWSPTLMGVGWKIQCSVSLESVEGYFASESVHADAYRDELLRIYALLAFLSVMENVYSLSLPASASIFCDNERAIEISAALTLYIHPKRKHSDILRALSHVKRILHCTLSFTHVRGHQEDSLSISVLSLPAQLNCQCDTLAKLALRRAFFREIAPGHSLPHEPAYVLVGNCKATSNVGKLLRFESGKSKARHFFAQKSILAGLHFNKVLWSHLHTALHKRSVAFRHWLTRHVSHFCGSLRMQH